MRAPYTLFKNPTRKDGKAVCAEKLLDKRRETYDEPDLQLSEYAPRAWKEHVEETRKRGRLRPTKYADDGRTIDRVFEPLRAILIRAYKRGLIEPDRVEAG